MAVVRAVATACPPHRHPQAELQEVAARLVPASAQGLLQVFANARIEGRALACPVSWYLRPHGLAERNRAFLEAGLPLAEAAARRALDQAGIAADRLHAIVAVCTTGLATPSLDALLANRLGCRPNVVRLPVWGLGCAGGVAGLNRAAALAREGPVLLVCLELCTLAFDVGAAAGAGSGAKRAIVAASLFGDGCAAAVLAPDGPGPRLVAGTSHLWPGTERVMGWDVADHGLDVVLSPDIPRIVRERLGEVVRPFLRAHGVERPDAWVLHPGGAKVVEAYGEALGLGEAELRLATQTLARHGNMSSPTVLFALAQALEEGAIPPGGTALLAALGPGFAAELALLRG
jgi:alkylresorcinol/alkylpyrone synthase